MKRVRIGTRGSRLAMAQSRMVADALCAAHPGIEAQLVPLVTRGDRRAGPLAPVGGKGLFTAELESALRARTVDLAVHSAKDVPAAMPDDLTIAAVAQRADPRDALISPGGVGLEQLPSGAAVGTSSLRRRAQLLAVRGDLKVVAIRGNIETRLRKSLAAGRRECDAAVLAMAGLLRSGLAEPHEANIRPLPVEAFVPAAGQGALAVQALSADAKVAELVAALDDLSSHRALMAERAVVAGLRAGCHSCLGVYVSPEPAGGWRGLAMAARPDGSDMRRFRAAGETAERVANQLLQDMTDDNVPELFAQEAGG